MESKGQTTDLTSLVRAARSGRTEAVERLVDAYAPRLYGLLYRMTGSAPDAEDLLQETYIKMLRGLDGYEESGRFEPWLFSIAANMARDWRRRQGRTIEATGPGVDANDGGEQTPTSQPQAESRAILAEQTDRLQTALSELSASEREIVTLRFFSDLSFKEIAQLLKVPLGTALARAHRAVRHLRAKMGPD